MRRASPFGWGRARSIETRRCLLLARRFRVRVRCSILAVPVTWLKRRAACLKGSTRWMKRRRGSDLYE